MKTLVHKYRLHLRDKQFLVSAALALVFLLASITVTFYANEYANEKASNAVTDIILSNTSAVNVDDIFVYGTLVLILSIAALCLLEPKRIPFTVKSVALFLLIRSFFISITHIGVFPTAVMIDSSLLNKFTFGADLFFSGHTGLPFLMALVFWDHRFIRYAFIATSVFFGIVVLLGHLHYSIDVASAFFITYTIYRLSEIFFKHDKNLFRHGILM